MNPARAKALKQTLDLALDEFVKSGEVLSDALEPALRYNDWHDRELSAFICAVIAYGRVEHIKKSIHRILDPMGSHPHQWLMTSSENDLIDLTQPWAHRFNSNADMLLLLKILKKIYVRYGSLEACFSAQPVSNAFQLIENFVTGVESLLNEDLGGSPRTNESFWFFLPKPSRGSACKRMNLFLRWMIGRGPLDFGLWTKFTPAILVIPLDVHVLRQARSLRLTRRKQADWIAAEEVTRALRHLDPDDPVQFDFALCHLGMRGRILR
jgi:uncharacterized protein (TIGR02757 family)